MIVSDPLSLFHWIPGEEQDLTKRLADENLGWIDERQGGNFIGGEKERKNNVFNFVTR